jgi:hypothetical protein
LQQPGTGRPDQRRGGQILPGQIRKLIDLIGGKLDSRVIEEPRKFITDIHHAGILLKLF